MANARLANRDIKTDHSLFGYDTLEYEGDQIVAMKGPKVADLRIGMRVRLEGDSKGYVPGGFSHGELGEIVAFRVSSDDPTDHVVRVAAEGRSGWVKPWNAQPVSSNFRIASGGPSAMADTPSNLRPGTPPRWSIEGVPLHEVKNADLFVLPISTEGTMGDWAELLATTEGLPPPPQSAVHGFVSAPQRGRSRTVVYAASVHEHASSSIIVEEIGKVLGSYSREYGYRRIATPLLGAGLANGRPRIEPLAARDALLAGFQATAHSDATLIIAVPEKDRIEQLREHGPERDAKTGPPRDPAAFGDGVGLSREARGNELRLEVDKYAATLANVLVSAQGEVCFALFGAWGRGKTTLVRRLCTRLREQQLAPRYRCVWFNAWKYRTAPETWAHLYERLVEGSSSDGWLTKRARIWRANVHRNGLTGLSLGLAVLAASLFALAQKPQGNGQLVAVLVAILGGATATWALTALHKMSEFMKQVWNRYDGFPSHLDKLGLQATIGHDVRLLLTGWIPQAFSPESEPNTTSEAEARLAGEYVVPPGPTLGQVSFLAGAIIAVAASIAICLGRAEGAGWSWTPFGVGIPLLWVLACLGWARVVWTEGRQVERILLVVDDLDRCAPDRMLDVIESIKLLVEEPGTRERLQVIVLVDDQILERAIATRLKPLFEQSTTPDGHVRAVREHMEKLFLGHLRLGPLTPEEIAELVGGIASNAGDRGVQPAPNSDAPLRPAGHGPEDASPSGGPSTRNGASARAKGPPRETVTEPTAASPARSTLRFTKSEMDLLARSCAELSKSSEGRLGPRGVRSFVFRYELGRELLKSFNENVRPEQIVARLLDPSGSTEGTTKVDALSEKAERILEQVSLPWADRRRAPHA